MMMLPGQLLESTDVVRQGESVYTMITALGAVLLHRLLSSVSAAHSHSETGSNCSHKVISSRLAQRFYLLQCCQGVLQFLRRSYSITLIILDKNCESYASPVFPMVEQCYVVVSTGWGNSKNKIILGLN